MWWLSARAATAGLAGYLLGGCVSLQAIEPVIAPPEKFRFGTLTQIEFASPALIGFRCAERGARLMGMPVMNSGACADAEFITMIDPCQTVTAGPYANTLCRNLRNADVADTKTSQTSRPSAETVSGFQRANFSVPGKKPAVLAHQLSGRYVVEFVPTAVLDSRCDGATTVASPGAILSCSVGNMLLLANPCEFGMEGWYERTLCHELAHVNGWASDHSGGEPRSPLRLASESPEVIALLKTRTPPAVSTR